MNRHSLYSESAQSHPEQNEIAEATEKQYLEGQQVYEEDSRGTEEEDMSELPVGKGGAEKLEEYEVTSDRRHWLCFTWMLTWWIPSFCLSTCGMKRPDVQIAWREKVALNFIVYFLCLSMLFIIIGVELILCPPGKNLTIENIAYRKTEPDYPLATFQGVLIDLVKLQSFHSTQYPMLKTDFYEQAGGTDLRNTFAVSPTACAQSSGDLAKLQPITFTPLNNDTFFPTFAHQDANAAAQMSMSNYKYGNLVWQQPYLTKARQQNFAYYVVYQQSVFDITQFILSTSMSNDTGNLLFPGLAQQLKVSSDLDITKFVDSLPRDSKAASLNCLHQLFYVGMLDPMQLPKCQIPSYILLVATCILASVIIIKFLSSLQLKKFSNPPQHDRFIVLQVPCYTEDHDSLKKSLDSLAKTDYDDKRKLIFVVCDGMIIGSGNDKPTPRIVLDLLGVDPNLDPEPCSYKALGEGGRQHNQAKVYSGLYEVEGHVVPYMVVVKCGTPTEKRRPGNRGKRDSQLVLLHFLSRVHYQMPMCPLDLEMYHQLNNIIGVHPGLYEYILMVDADTLVLESSLKQLITGMVDDSRIMGLCGETQLANNDGSWATMIQVYEYYISHHLSKAFESMFGTVTCLPGCFSMYRVRTQTKQPLVVNKELLEAYADNHVDTLHKKNLLMLGEDRYLTTLLLRHFPKGKTKFTPAAKAETFAPESWRVLLSQRRRWINSTVHNLFQLVYHNQLCGFCLFSMRFVVFLDLFATLVQPSVMLYVIYLILRVTVIGDTSFPLISVIIIAVAYGLQAVVFILNRRFEQIGWMIIYIIGTPLFAFFIPLYSFWHFDDFSWGNTRVVVGEGKHKQVLNTEADTFDESEIPMETWEDFSKRMADEDDNEAIGAMDTLTEGMQQDPLRVSRMSGLSGWSGLSGAGGIQQQDQTPLPPPGAAMVPPGSHVSYRHSQMLQHPGAIMDPRSSYFSQQTPLPDMMMTDYHQQPRQSLMSMGSSMSPYPIYEQPPMATQPLQENGEEEYPSQAELEAEIQRILSSSDLSAITKKQIRKELSAYFGASLSHRKQWINQCIDRNLASLP